MRKRNIWTTAAVVISAMLLGGCGDAPYELTEQEESIIVNYSAHIVAKYNTYQKEGLTAVDVESLQETDTENSDADDSALGEDVSADGTVSDGSSGGTQADGVSQDAAQTVTLEELFAEDGVYMDYVGARLMDSYSDASYYSIDADEGMTYLVLGIDITNTNNGLVDIDNLSAAPQFRVTVNGTETGTAELTILTEDFATFIDTLDAGETIETVLLFQIPETVVSVESLTLTVSMNGNNYQINLEN